jgi:hypothetical protein
LNAAINVTTPPSIPPADPTPPKKIFVLVRDVLFAKYRWLPVVWEFIKKEYAGLKQGWLLFLIALLLLSYPAVRLWQSGLHANLLAKVEEIQRQDRELATLRHENQNLVVENNRLKIVLDPVERKAKELYPDLEASAAISKLAKDLEDVRNLATRVEFKPLSVELRKQVLADLNQVHQLSAGEKVRFVIGYEHGSEGRAKLAEELAKLLKESGMSVVFQGAGEYSTVGQSFETPVRVFVHLDSPAQNLYHGTAPAISRLLTSGVVGLGNPNTDTNEVVVQILGIPAFLPDGSVIFQ